MGPSTEALKIAAPLTVLTASLLGSAHCAGMCGPILGLVARGLKEQFFYHGGRLLSYLGLGFLASTLGLVYYREVQTPAAAILSLVIAFLLSLFFLLAAWSLLRKKSFHFMPLGIYQWIFQKSAGPFRAGLFGLTTGFLPCGWLYLFVAAAALAGSPQRSLLVMFFFWLGTLPALSTLSYLLRKLPVRSVRAAFVVLSLLSVVVLGIRVKAVLQQGNHGGVNGAAAECH